jgi:spore maturation protein CgeB
MASTLDLQFRLGCTPAWWQLFKALYETGNEVIVIPYLGKPINSLWWRTYENPCYRESVSYNAFLEWRIRRGVSPSKPMILSPMFDLALKYDVRRKFKQHLINVMRQEDDVDCVLFMNIPLNHMTGIPSAIKNATGVPLIYYDGDMPSSLPAYAVDRRFKFDYYKGAVLSEYDAFLTNSEGCIPDLEAMGAHNVQPFHYGIDPDLCSPIDLDKKYDVSFYGHGSDLREKWIDMMITQPSHQMPEVKFVAGGGEFDMDLGRAHRIGQLTYSRWRDFCCHSKINLNITRWSHASIYASSTSRPFELAAFGACIVSQPYNGIEKWFEIGKELFVVQSAHEAVQTYAYLMDHEEQMEEAGVRARDRVLKEHTFKDRASQLIQIIRSLRKSNNHEEFAASSPVAVNAHGTSKDTPEFL